jgi:GH15 family glucan-1,4-alpha-glucosidase
VALAIEDYALIGDCHTAALIGNNGSIDWLCMPRFDSPSIFGGLLGSDEQGHWTLAPADAVISTSRMYHDDSFVLVTRWVTDAGEVEVIETMPQGDRRADVIRRVRGIHGTVRMHQSMRMRFDYARALPWVRQLDGDDEGMVAIAGPDALVYRGPRLTATDHVHSGEFTVEPEQTTDLSITWFPSHRRVPGPIDADERIAATTEWWQNWASSAEAPLEYGEAVRRSLLVLRALTHEDTSGIVAAATTSLPEQFGGERNWDYRYVWLRDASLTLDALLAHGYKTEAEGWRSWLLRAVAGDPDDVQIMYGLAGERSLGETELSSLPGYRAASPVRIGNDAATQFQGDVFGEVMLALRHARELGLTETTFSWPLQVSLAGYVERNWDRPDNGIWEIRGRRRHFTHSRVMLWAALDCAIEGAREFDLPGPVDRWESLRATIAAEIEEKGFNAEHNTYVQSYGTKKVDAALLQLPQVGYLAYDDPRMLGTVAAIEKELLEDGLVLRYRTSASLDGLPPGEHHFLACSFWLVEQYAHTGRLDDARRLMDTLMTFTNDVGLLSEEYDVRGGRQVGNMPQAFSHLALVRAADAIARNA